MRNTGDISTDEDEEEKEYRLNRIKGKSPEEIDDMNKKKKNFFFLNLKNFK